MLKSFPKFNYSNDRTTHRTAFDIRDLKISQPQKVFVDQETIVKELQNALNDDYRIDQLEQQVSKLHKMVSGNFVISTGLIGLIIWSHFHN